MGNLTRAGQAFSVEPVMCPSKRELPGSVSVGHTFLVILTPGYGDIKKVDLIQAPRACARTKFIKEKS